jgi:acetyl-CoA acetyltransferase
MAEKGVAVVGVGMHRFGRTEGVSGLAMGEVAVRGALADAGIAWPDVQFAFGGSYESGDADSLVSGLGLTGVPFVNVYNGCGTGGSALFSARNAIESGLYDVGVVVGFDKHPPGSFNEDPENLGLGAWYGEAGYMLTTQFFATKIRRYMHDYGITEDALVEVAAKAYRNGALDPNAWRTRPISNEEIAESLMVNDPLTKYMFCSPSEGAVALVLARADKAADMTDHPIRLRSVEFRTRRFGTFECYAQWMSPERVPGPTAEASRAAFQAAGIEPSDVDVAQIQDTESGAEIMHMAETGLCEHGQQEELIMSGATAIDGSLPINTDGGVLAHGEPIGATGLRQVHEIVLQLRGDAGERQVANDPEIGFTQVYGSPGIAACAVLSR